MKFWYHMMGSQFGKLRVYYQAWGDSTGTLLWEYGQDKGDTWYMGQLPILASSTQYQVSKTNKQTNKQTYRSPYENTC